MTTQTFNSVWDAIENSSAEAENMKLRSILMIELEKIIQKKQWTQAEAAHHFRVTQPRISDLVRGKINLFTVDVLVNMLASVNKQIEITIKEAA